MAKSKYVRVGNMVQQKRPPNGRDPVLDRLLQMSRETEARLNASVGPSVILTPRAK
jgi:hypothetical protein